VKIGDSEMHKASFRTVGKAPELLPGLSGGLAAVQGKAMLPARP
jgi:hypothetical protein